jgi:hypothetical protein
MVSVCFLCLCVKIFVCGFIQRHGMVWYGIVVLNRIVTIVVVVVVDLMCMWYSTYGGSFT